MTANCRVRCTLIKYDVDENPSYPQQDCGKSLRFWPAVRKTPHSFDALLENNWRGLFERPTSVGLGITT